MSVNRLSRVPKEFRVVATGRIETGSNGQLDQSKLAWQSKLVLLLVLPCTGAGLVLQTQWWGMQFPSVAVWTIGASLLLALVVLKLRAATLAGAFTGAVITASLMFSTVTFPYRPWQTALPPVLAVSLLAWIATKVGREKKERLGTAEKRHGRSAEQVAANLGVAAIVCFDQVRPWMANTRWFSRETLVAVLLIAPGLAALAEAAADTVSSEIGQVMGGRPRMITTLRAVDAGTDGAVSLAGTLAGVIAACIVAGIGTLALRGSIGVFWVSCAGGVFGLLFDSLLGATLERRGWLNNDAVNFLSTASAAAFALGVLAVWGRVGVG
jgi:uncharacterized protein (TIGR00297 family)